MVGRTPADAHTPPESLRLALEELGADVPFFFFFFPPLSTRVPDRADELLNTAPAVPGDVVEDIIERELHARADAAFATFASRPARVRVGWTGPRRDAA